VNRKIMVNGELVVVLYRPTKRYLSLSDGNIYDRDSDTVIMRDTLHLIMEKGETDE